MFVFDKAIDQITIEKYKTTMEDHYNKMVKAGHSDQDWYPCRNVGLLTTSDIVLHVKGFLESRIRMTTTCYDAQIQIRKDGMGGFGTHKHDHDGREHGDYNSILYLNDNFSGGEFYTETGIIVKPVAGRLTFFDGKNISHGVKKFTNSHRYGIVFWWKNTTFY